MSGGGVKESASERLARLEREIAAIEDALDQVNHDVRRCRDSLERAGWRSPELERHLDALERERARLEQDRTRIREERRALRAARGMR